MEQKVALWALAVFAAGMVAATIWVCTYDFIDRRDLFRGATVTAILLSIGVIIAERSDR